MAFSGGVFSRIYNWVSDKNSAIPITASRMDTEDNGFATGLSTCLLKDGTQTVTANIPFSGFRLTGVGAATARTDAAQAAQAQDNAYNFCTVAGTANAIAITSSPATASRVTGRRLAFKATANSTNVVTINENGLGALKLFLSGGVTQAFSGSIQNNNWYIVTFDSALDSATGGYVMDSLGLGGAAYLNTGTVIVNDGSGNLTIATDAAIPGSPTTTTQASSDNSTKIATTAQVLAAIKAFSAPITNSLSGDVTITTAGTYYDGPSVAQGSTGTWFASGTVTVNDSTGSGITSIFAKLWDGTTVIATLATDIFVNTNAISLSLSGYLPSPAGNLRISVTSARSGSSKIIFNASGLSKDSTITAIRIA